MQQHQGPHALAQLTGKLLYCNLPLDLLKQLGVRRILQLPGYALLTYPVSLSTLLTLYLFEPLCFLSTLAYLVQGSCAVVSPRNVCHICYH